MENGSAPPKPVRIERVCSENCVTTEAVTNRAGEYSLRGNVLDAGAGWIEFRCGGLSMESCHVRATLPGYDSTYVEVVDPLLLKEGRLPDIVLSRHGSQPPPEFTQLPRRARKAWQAGVQAFGAADFAEAENQLREVVRMEPKYVPAWNALGRACQKQKNYTDARDAFARALALAPNSLSTRLLALRLESETQQWETTARMAEELVRLDKTHRYAEAYLHLAVAQGRMNKLEEAERNASEAIRLDNRHELLNAAAIRAEIVEARLQPPSQARIAPKVADVQLNLSTTGHVRLPGGPLALARLAGFAPPKNMDSYFEVYARALVARGASTGGDSVTGFADTLRAYFLAVAGLAELGQPRATGTLIKLSTATPEERQRTERALRLLGLTLTAADGGERVRFSEEQPERVRHPVARVLGLDIVGLMDALKAGRPFEFEIVNSEAPVLGGDAWLGLSPEAAQLPGGVAEAFARDARLAKTYAGLSAAGSAASTALVTHAGLLALLGRDAEMLFQHGAALRMQDGVVLLPGGQNSADAWAAVAGKAPRDPGAFFLALLEKDRGRLISFYSTLQRMDARRATLLTATPERLKALYATYAVADAGLYAHCPVNDERLKEFVAAGVGLRRALAAITELEDKREAPLDAVSLELLRTHYAEWRPLWPYFERFKRLDADDFRALERFETVVRGATPGRRQTLLGAWYSLVELSSDASAFRAACKQLAEGRLPVELFKSVLPDTPVPTTLDEAARVLVERTYAARLDPRMLLRLEYPRVALRHVFASGGHVFEDTRFEPSNGEEGSRFGGGLMRLEEVGRPLARVPASATWRETDPLGPAPVESFAKAEPQELVFRSDVGLVEVYATVRDARGHYVDDLKAGDFAVVENGEKLSVRAFENAQSEITCALVLDSTMSMHQALPMLKNSALRLISELRTNDLAGGYTFSNTLVGTGQYTRDKLDARRAVVAMEARGETALYDALVGVLHELAARPGKKALVVFTDGNDNVSTLSLETAGKRARLAGIPLFAVAQGEALNDRVLLAKLESIAALSGGMCFRVRYARDVEAVFGRIAKELSHGYLISVSPHAGEPGAWHSIAVETPRAKNLEVRSRQGYYVP